MDPNIFFIIYVVLKFLTLEISTNQISDLIGKFNQHDYYIKMERIELKWYDKNYYTMFDVKSFKYNRTAFAFNVTFEHKIDIKNDGEMFAQVYKFMSNEYRYFPIRLQLPYCDMVKGNVIGLGFSKCGNFSGCPDIKGKRIHLCNWTPDDSKFPPLIPTGRYKLELRRLQDSKEIFEIHGFGEIKKPIVYK